MTLNISEYVESRLPQVTIFFEQPNRETGFCGGYKVFIYKDYDSLLPSYAEAEIPKYAIHEFIVYGFMSVYLGEEKNGKR